MEKEVKELNKEEKKKSIFKEASTYFLIIVFVILLRSFVVTPVRVNGSSMYKTLEDKEIMVLDKISYRFSAIRRFDIVVIDAKNYVGNDDKFIKRVIGLPGDKLYYKDDVLYINDEAVSEYYKQESTHDFNVTSLGYETIPDNCYIVMGDNRDNSLDSRMFGCVLKEDILGKANLTIFPFNKFGVKK